MSEITQHDVNKCLTYSCVAFDLRQAFTIRGIPPTEEVVIAISNIEGKELAEITLPSGSEALSMPSTAKDPRQEIINFLNKADVQFNLLEMLTKLNLDSSDSTQPTKKLYHFFIKCGHANSISELAEDIPLTIIKYTFGIISPCGLYRPCCSV